MAKSLFEPKKIVRYANNQELIEGGLAGQSTPSRQVSATRSVPKTDSIPADASNVGSSNTPVDFGGSTGDNNPPPPPPPSGFTRAVLLDGATELSASYDPAIFGNIFRGAKIAATVTPHWSGSATGSYPILSISNPSDSEDFEFQFGIKREHATISPVTYRDYVYTRISSGSNGQHFQQKVQLEASPNFYSGSSENVFIQIVTNFGEILGKKEGSNTSIKNRQVSFKGSKIKISNTVLTANSHNFIIGSSQSGSKTYFTGSLTNLTVSSIGNSFYGSTMPFDLGTSPSGLNGLQAGYRFEESVSASITGIDLDVNGTQAYVTSSI